MSNDKSSKRSHNYDGLFGDDELELKKKTARNSKNEYWTRLSTPTNRFTRKDTDAPQPKKRRVCISHNLCPPRVDQLATPTVNRLEGILSDYHATLEADRICRIVKLIHTNKDAKPVRHSIKRHKKKRSAKRLKKKEKQRLEKLWLDKQTSLTAQLVTGFLSRRVAYTPNYKQVMLSMTLMNALKLKTKDKLVKQNVQKICEQLAILADREWEPYYKFDDFESESEVEEIPEEDKKKIIFRVSTTALLEDQLDSEAFSELDEVSDEDDLVAPGEEDRVGPSTIFEETDEGLETGSEELEDEYAVKVEGEEVGIKEELDEEDAIQQDGKEYEDIPAYEENRPTREKDDYEAGVVEGPISEKPGYESETNEGLASEKEGYEPQAKEPEDNVQDTDETRDDVALVKREPGEASDVDDNVEEIKEEPQVGEAVKSEPKDAVVVKQEPQDAENIKQGQEDAVVVKEEPEDAEGVKQDQEDAVVVKQEPKDSESAKQDQEDAAVVKQEPTDMVGDKEESKNLQDVKDEPKGAASITKEQPDAAETVQGEPQDSKANQDSPRELEAKEPSVKSDVKERASVKKSGSLLAEDSGTDTGKVAEPVAGQALEEEGEGDAAVDKPVKDKVGDKKTSKKPKKSAKKDIQASEEEEAEKSEASVEEEEESADESEESIEGEEALKEDKVATEKSKEESEKKSKSEEERSSKKSEKKVIPVFIHENHPEGTASYVSYRIYSSWLEEFAGNIQTYSNCLRTFREIVSSRDSNAAQHSPAIRTVLLNWSTYLSESIQFETAIKDYFKGKLVTRCNDCLDKYDVYNLPTEEEHTLPIELRTALQHSAHWTELLTNAEEHCKKFVSASESRDSYASHVTIEVQDVTSMISEESAYIIEEV